ncbi:hypothetical protein BDZ89DRAFT_77070 [Hymenopellis radicata]|nr:hypothetical protein BDZ89DRAFT_77070 [Hymenopellis radicata]
MSTLPLELLLLIFDNVLVRTLTSLSVCSHQIRILVFPLLYRHVVFKKNKDLSQFRLRVISEAHGGTLIDELRVADHVRHLEFGSGSGRDVCTRRMSWSLLPENRTIFVEAACKASKILVYILRTTSKVTMMITRQLFSGSKDLHAWRSRTYAMSLDSEKLPSSMVDMIRASPNLITLDLSLDTYGDLHPKWDIDTLFRSIDIAPTTLRLRKGLPWIFTHSLIHETHTLSLIPPVPS